MKLDNLSDLSRRGLLKGLLALPFAGLLARRSEAYSPTPEIPDQDEPTPSQTAARSTSRRLLSAPRSEMLQQRARRSRSPARS